MLKENSSIFRAIGHFRDFNFWRRRAWLTYDVIYQKLEYCLLDCFHTSYIRCMVLCVRVYCTDWIRYL